MKEILINIWNWLDGSKSIILLGTANAMQQAMLMEVISNSNINQFIVYLLLGLSTGTIFQHIKKQTQ